MAYPMTDNTEPSLYDVLRQMGKSMASRSNWAQLGQGAGRAAKSIPSVAESLGRGSIASLPGTFGDVEGLGRAIIGNQNPNVLPTTEDILHKMPRLSQPTDGAETFETVGSFAGPLAPLTKLAKLAKLKKAQSVPSGLQQARAPIR
jgi:hypothetical protein